MKKKKNLTVCGFCQNDLAVKDLEILNLLLSCVVDYALNIIGADWFPNFLFSAYVRIHAKPLVLTVPQS